jgi:XTP/dITP diphosphohydrolase
MSESDLHVKNRALRKLKGAIRDLWPPEDVKISFVTSYPRSDMGKGTFVAQLLATLEDTDVIKFDGLLNTNKSGRHTTPGHDDFGTYEQFSPSRTWGKDSYILGGELYKNFIDNFGELENLRIKQHLSLYLELEVYRLWRNHGSARHLFIEIGGVLSDPEVEPIFVPLIQRLQKQRQNTEVILVTESGHNGEYVKTKTIQDGVSALLSNHITPTIIAAREPEILKKSSDFERIQNERAIINRIDDNLGHLFTKVVSIPFFKQQDMKEYTAFVEKRVVPLFQSNKTIQVVIGTSNQSKFDDYKIYLNGKFELLKGSDLVPGIDIPEGMHSIEENAIAKARTWAILTGKTAVADDTGFFVKALDGEPGIAVRRWGGELGEEADHVAFWQHLQKKLLPLDNTESYFDQCVAIVTPSGEVRILHNKTEGYIDKNKLKVPYNGTGYPLAAAFVAFGRQKAWDEMSDDEKRVFDADFIEDLEKNLSLS